MTIELDAPEAGPVDAAQVAVRSRGVRAFLRIPEASIGSVLLVLMLLLVIFGPLFAPYRATSLVGIPSSGPSSSHLLGTDTFGRDVLSRLLAGGRSVLLLPLLAVSLSIAFACLVGLLAGYLGGVVDAIVTRVIDVALAIPPFLTVLVLLAGFGTGDAVVVLAVAVVYVPSVARVLRAATQAVRPREFILAARARGESVWWITFREIAPNIAPTLLVEVALRLTFAIMFIASLSFLGLGVQPPSSNWGVMVGENRGLLFIHPLPVIAPAIAIGLLAISINLIADGLTQYFGDDTVGEMLL